MFRDFDVYLIQSVRHWWVRAASKELAVKKVIGYLGDDWDVLMDPQDPHKFYRLEAWEADEEPEEELDES